MTRERSAGRRSRLMFSPRQNMTGGVERSTSRTKPGRGIGSGLPHVEGNFDRVAGAGGGRVADGGVVLVEPVGGADESAEPEAADELDRRLEVLAAIGVAPGHPHL